MQYKLAMISMVAMIALAGPAHVHSVTFVQSWDITTGADILVFVGGGSSFSNSADLFNSSYTQYGNNVTVVKDYNWASADLGDWDAILLTNFENASYFSTADLAALQAYVELGNKFLWVAGNSDYGEYYKANNTANVVLNAVASNLRIDGGSIEDPASNDRAAYRVVANETGVSSTAVDYVTNGFVYTVYHGPAAVAYYNYNTAKYGDLRTADIASMGIDIYVNSSQHAVATDAGSLSDYDVYPYVDLQGNYPMLVSQVVNSSVVVASGEASFSDYKEMYDWIFEQQKTPHDGIMIVDRMLAYWLTDSGMNMATLTHQERSRIQVEVVYVTETETETVTENQTLTETLTQTTPFSTTAAVVGLFAVPAVMIILKRRKN